ncbi:MAG: helix-turn-helix transcriptional regulator [Lentisphaerae bacterium]|nr:helix-turn-helix transcriptional regulator [Lentisphaerota bacterium]
MSSLYFDPVIRFVWEGPCRDHWHEGPRWIFDCLLEYAVAGSYLVTIEKRPQVMRSGSILILPPGVVNEYRLIKNRGVFRRCIHFDWTREFSHLKTPIDASAAMPFQTALRHTVPPAIAVHLPLITHVRERPGTRGLLQNLWRALRNRPEQSGYLLWPVLRCLLADRAGAEHTWPTGKTAKAIILLKHYIENQYAKPIGYPEFSDVTRMSESHLCQAFRKLLGAPPARYLREVRLDHAKRLLEESTLNVAEVAAAVGLSDANYFTRVFRKRFGQCPSRTITEGG